MSAGKRPGKCNEWMRLVKASDADPTCPPDHIALYHKRLSLPGPFFVIAGEIAEKSPPVN